MLCSTSIVGFPYKRPSVGKQFVEHYAERENITPGIHRPARRLLRGHVSHCSQNRRLARVAPRREFESRVVLFRLRLEQLR